MCKVIKFEHYGIFRQWKKSGTTVATQKGMVPLKARLEIEGGSQTNEGLVGHAKCLDFNL